MKSRNTSYRKYLKITQFNEGARNDFIRRYPEK